MNEVMLRVPCQAEHEVQSAYLKEIIQMRKCTVLVLLRRAFFNVKCMFHFIEVFKQSMQLSRPWEKKNGGHLNDWCMYTKSWLKKLEAIY